MTQREFLDIVFALVPKEANTIMDAFDEYVESAQLGTNLAEVGTDCISRQAAIDAARDWYEGLICGSFKGLEKRLRSLPPAQPDIIRCKDCKYAEYIDDVQTFWCTECGQGRTVAPDDFCSYGDMREVTT